MQEYQKYQHVTKLGNQETFGILEGTCYVFPKLDGTNAQVWLDPEDKSLKCGSRKRELTLDHDNAGFMNWAIQNEKLKRAMSVLDEMYPRCRLAGEWLVPHTLKTYKDDSWRKFYIFDVVLHNGTHLPYDTYKPILEVAELDYIPAMAIIERPAPEDLTELVKKNDYLVTEGIGEGIVVKNYDFVNKYGRQVWSKIVTSEFKSKNQGKKEVVKTAGTSMVEDQIINEFLTDEIIDKVYANIITQEGGWDCSFIPRLLNTVYYDLVREHSWDMIKKFKSPTINFGRLKGFCIKRIKEYKKELF